MFSIVKIGAHQELVNVGSIVTVDKQNAPEGDIITLPAYLISNEDGSIMHLGTPLLEGITVSAKVLEHDRTAKMRVFKMKPKKRMRRNHTHRQDFTRLEIVSFNGI